MSELMQVTVDQSGRILLPESLRTRLGFFPGMTLIVKELDDKEILLQSTSQVRTLINKEGVLVVQGQATGEIASAEKQEREKRISELVGRIGL